MAKFTNKPVAMAVGAAFFASAAPQLVNADTNPFSATPLNSGYDLANHAGHPEGKCGGKKLTSQAKMQMVMALLANVNLWLIQKQNSPNLTQTVTAN